MLYTGGMGSFNQGILNWNIKFLMLVNTIYEDVAKIFCLISFSGVPVRSLSTQPLTVHAEFPDSIILYWDCVEHNICPYIRFPTAGKNPGVSAIVPERRLTW